MIQFYIQNEKNQENFLNRSKDVPSCLIQDIECTVVRYNKEYENRLTYFEKRIYRYFFRYYQSRWIKIRHSTIANKIGCSTKTIQRATNRFMGDGVIMKMQSHEYSPNNYTWGPNIGIVRMPDGSIVVDGNVQLNKLSLDLLYIYNPVYKPVYKPVYGSTPGRSNKKLRDQVMKPGISTKIHTKTEGNGYGFVDVRPGEFRVLQGKIVEKLKCDAREKIKLEVYPIEVLEWAYKEYLAAVGSLRISNGTALFFSLCGKYCTRNNIKPHWRHFFDLCASAGIDTAVPGYSIEKIPAHNVSIQTGSVSRDQSSVLRLYPVYRKVEKTDMERMRELEKSISSAYGALASARLNPFLQNSLEFIRVKLEDEKRELEALQQKLRINDTALS